MRLSGDVGGGGCPRQIDILEHEFLEGNIEKQVTPPTTSKCAMSVAIENLTHPSPQNGVERNAAERYRRLLCPKFQP